jgi:hypothetical protein
MTLLQIALDNWTAGRSGDDLTARNAVAASILKAARNSARATKVRWDHDLPDLSGCGFEVERAPLAPAQPQVSRGTVLPSSENEHPPEVIKQLDELYAEWKKIQSQKLPWNVELQHIEKCFELHEREIKSGSPCQWRMVKLAARAVQLIGYQYGLAMGDELPADVKIKLSHRKKTCEIKFAGYEFEHGYEGRTEGILFEDETGFVKLLLNMERLNAFARMPPQVALIRRGAASGLHVLKELDVGKLTDSEVRKLFGTSDDTVYMNLNGWPSIKTARAALQARWDALRKQDEEQAKNLFNAAFPVPMAITEITESYVSGPAAAPVSPIDSRTRAIQLRELLREQIAQSQKSPPEITPAQLVSSAQQTIMAYAEFWEACRRDASLTLNWQSLKECVLNVDRVRATALEDRGFPDPSAEEAFRRMMRLQNHPTQLQALLSQGFPRPVQRLQQLAAWVVEFYAARVDPKGTLSAEVDWNLFERDRGDLQATRKALGDQPFPPDVEAIYQRLLVAKKPAADPKASTAEPTVDSLD